MQLLEFITEQWLLVSAFVLLLLMLIGTELRNRMGAARISPQQATQLINKQNAVIIDLRDELAYKKGHILGAWHILPAQLLTHEKLSQQKSNPILLVCQAGHHAPGLGRQLHKLGFTQVYSLIGGIDNWQTAGLLLVKGK